MRLRRLVALAAIGGAALPAATASTAHASVLVKSAEDCPTSPYVQPFKPWLDYMSYTLVPGGSFEDGAPGWELSGASIASGSETFYVGNPGDTRSLSVPAGGSAESPTVCAGLDHPTMRFFARSKAPLLSSLLSSLRVEVLATTSLGQVVSVPVGVATYSTSWQPSLPLPVVANLLPLLPNDLTPVAFRFTPQGPAGWWIDDVYLDPRRRS